MAIGSKNLAPSELDSFEDSRLTEELRRAKEELFNLRFQSATGQLEGHGRVRAVKRDIARIYTVMRERELGIRATPAPAPVTEAKPKRSRAKKDDAATDTTTETGSVSSTPTAAESEETK
ncbi:MAG: rpmC [Frankiales bacterium]|nr:rpmC [Frankiales bacterium]